jgi:GNAT superfamily N-acetyltransferase
MIDVLELEECGFAAWPALRSVCFGGWVFRLGGGYTKRANSANALGGRADSVFPEVLAEAERFYAVNGQPAIFRLTPLAGRQADSALEAAGYARFDPCTVMTAPLDQAAADPAVRVVAVPTPVWLDGIAAAQGVAGAHRLIHDRIVQAITPPAAFATALVGDEPAGFGLGVAERGAVGLFDIIMRPEFRGQGLGRRLARALMAWGRDGGARTAYLQVGDDNSVARALYETLGFRPAYPYHYRRRIT